MEREVTSTFQFLDDLEWKKVGILNEENLKDYSPFVVNRFLSACPDCLMHAMQMNERRNLAPELNFLYYFHALRPRKRFSKWLKRPVDKRMETICQYFDYSLRQAQMVSHLISDEQIRLMESRMDKGGVVEEPSDGVA